MVPRNALVIGTGTMGPGIAAMFALAGSSTVLVGRTSSSAEEGVGRACAAAASLEQHGLRPPGSAAEAGRRLSVSADLEAAAASADFVVESIIEDLDAKKECFSRLGGSAPPDAVLVTNTSGLRVTDIASAVRHPERVAGMHWWNPPHLIPLVEVVAGEATGEDTTARVAGVASALGKRPVVVRRDVPGFIGNRLQYALLREAVNLVEQGIASPEDVDLAMRAGPGLRYAAFGPLETADLIGLDVVARVMAHLLPALSTAAAAPARLAQLVNSGDLGCKSGRGFYDYSDRPHTALAAERDARLVELLRAVRNIAPGQPR